MIDLYHNSVNNIRNEFSRKLREFEFVTDKSGVKTIEIIGASFWANRNETIFGDVNEDYVARELEWYKSQSLFVKDIPGKTPTIWEQVADKEGKINSNYGYLIWSFENWNQYASAFEELKKNPDSRRAIMIYTRPSMQVDYNKNGMSDFICTNTVQYFIRNDINGTPVLRAIVNMRSNDAIFGYRNDFAWQKYVLEKLASDLDIPVGGIQWNAGSLHIYERHFYLVDHWSKTQQTHITKEEYHKLYPDKIWGLPTK